MMAKVENRRYEAMDACGQSIGYRQRACFYDVEYRAENDQPFLGNLVTEQVETILEIPCGAGRNVRWLADTGRRVVCADLEPSMVERVRWNVAELGAEDRITPIVADIRNLRLGECFDLILVPQEAFQLLTDSTEASRALSFLRDHLSSPGTLLIDVHSFTADLYGERESWPDYFDPTAPDGVMIREWSRQVDDTRILSRSRTQHGENEIFRVVYYYTLNDGKETINRWHCEVRLLRHDPWTVAKLAEEVGLRVARSFRNYAGDAYMPGAARAVMLLESVENAKGDDDCGLLPSADFSPQE